jgi:hypothetical protein
VGKALNWKGEKVRWSERRGNMEIGRWGNIEIGRRGEEAKRRNLSFEFKHCKTTIIFIQFA